MDVKWKKEREKGKTTTNSFHRHANEKELIEALNHLNAMSSRIEGARERGKKFVNRIKIEFLHVYNF